MKFLVAFAFVAVASAVTLEDQPVELQEAPMPDFEMPDIRPLFVPEEVLRQVKLAEEINEAPANLDDGLMVHVVDFAPFDELKFVDEVLEDSDQSYAVKFVDSPLEVNQDADQPQPINVVDDVPLEVQDQEIPVESVRVADILPPRYPSKVYPDPMWR